MGSSLVPEAETQEGILDADQSKSIFKAMMGSMFPAAEVLDDDLAEEDPGVVFDTTQGGVDTEKPDETSGGETEALVEDSLEHQTANIDETKPVVIIYHTHATESYEPVSEGNFHTLDVHGTVREVATR
jgi:stage II sporulation protein P